MDAETQICHYCGASLPEGAVKCSKCGREVFKQRFLGQILIDEGIVSRDKLTEAIRLQKRKLGEILLDIGACRAEDLDRALTLQKLGRTRLDLYVKYLKIAVGLLAVTVFCLVTALYRLQKDKQFLLRMQKEELTVDEVRQVLSGSSSHSKFEALRSLSRHLKQPEAIQLLKYALRTETWYVKLYAVVLARKSKDPSLIPDLLHIMKEDPEIVAPVASDAVKEITEAQVGVQPEPETDPAADPFHGLLAHPSPSPSAAGSPASPDAPASPGSPGPR